MIVAIIGMMIAIHLTWHLLPRTQKELEANQATIRHNIRLKINREDTTLCSIYDTTWVYDAAWVNKYRLLPSCRGRLIGNTKNLIENKYSKSLIYKEIEKKKKKITSEIEQLQFELKEVKYFLRSHGVQDEGFDIAKRREDFLKKTLTERQNISNSINDCLKINGLTIIKEEKMTVVYRNTEDSIVEKPCKLIKKLANGTTLFQSLDKTKPSGIRPRYYGLTEILSPSLSTTDSLNYLTNKILKSKVGKCFKPSFTYHISIDSLGRRIVGKYANDTLISGTRYDSNGIYQGELNNAGKANGHGTYTDIEGNFYEGHWLNDMREGFGFESRSKSHARAGEWQANTFKGERLNYTSERIYGIDISRYQHDIGKKSYPIDWNNLRITHLGQISKKRISGRVDYPVRFVYIKSTEGTTIYNKYYAADYNSARKHVEKVGTYHFFSTKTSGKQQAEYFLKMSKISRGDMPPVLDVEPTHAQITAMGGADIMFREIRTWMNIVEKATGCRPILYVGQSFVNRYLVDAPDIKKKYNIWIARYGEYKPDVHLVYWQLSPDGKISGIHGDVDINVFNGYNDTYLDFLNTHCVK